MGLGLYGLRLPFDDADGALIDCIKVKTLPTFSSFFPYRKIYELEPERDLKVISNKFNKLTCQLPDFMSGVPIVRIDSVEVVDADYYSTPYVNAGISSYQSMMLGNLGADLLSTLTKGITYDFREPNILILHDVPDERIKLEVHIGFRHLDNLSSISEGFRESFIELATIDVKQFLFNTLKHYTEINSAFGNINLKIDDWSNAEGDRRDLIEKYRSTYHLESKVIDYI